ncbi:MAG: ABC transporter permease [Melioribacteraceae bacterium]|nr:ABC transporter permease [Melioribacteraceae bacterium]
MLARIKSIALKEIRQLKRDSRMLYVLFGFPLLLLVLFGYAINFDVKNIKLAIFDQDRSDISREFYNSLNATEYFEIVRFIESDSEIKTILDKKKAQAVIVIPHDFSTKLYSAGEEPKIQFLVDGVDGNTATIIYNYFNAATASLNVKLQSEILAKNGKKFSPPIALENIFWFNPELKTENFLVPGLIAMILIITAVISVALSLVREKERGTIEQINVSSINTFELLLGKSIPFIVIAMIDAVIILIAGFILFGIVIKGSIILLFISTLIFIAASISLGIFVSVVSDSQQIAFTLATFLSLLPAMLLSGFVFPIEGMPTIIQIITNITPAKFFIVVLRGIVLKGVGLYAFWEQLLYLTIYGTVFLGLATIIRNKKAVE